jgi:PiT family inorganic phosphate transporter
MLLLATSLVMVFALAWTNGANDVAKGVATLVGSGVSNARRAILWGSACTLLGGVAAVWWGASLLETFGGDFVAPHFRIDLLFVISTLAGASAWVLAATRLSLPVSTTHALLGGVVGSVLFAAGPEGLRAAVVANKAVLPLLVSPLLAVLLCALILSVARYVGKRVPAWRPGCCAPAEWQRNPYACANDNAPPLQRAVRERMWHALHWLSSGATSFARGLNDVPKIAAFLVLAVALAPLPEHIVTPAGAWLVIAVSVVMAAGGVWGGYRVLNVLAHRVTAMDPGTGLAANTGTSLLVLAATPLGLPVSTTQVSTGALVGIRWVNRSPPGEADALKLILFGWIITLPVAGAVSAIASFTLHQIG